MLLSLAAGGCGKPSAEHPYRKQREWFTRNGKIKVLTTICMIHDLVDEVGGDRVDVLSLVHGELDPHTYQLVKGDDEKLSFADLIFYNGLGLEHGASTSQYLQKSPKAISLGERLFKEHPDQILYANGVIDPHIWMDISLWSKTVPSIVQALSRSDPDHAAEYRERGNNLILEMAKQHEEVRGLLQSIPEQRRYLVTSHDAFQYFARAYLREDQEQRVDQWEKRFAAPEGLAPESQLSSHDIRTIVDHLQKYDIPVIFPESNVSRDSIRKIKQVSRQQGKEVTIAESPLYGDAMGPVGSSGDTYLKMIQHNARTIHQYLAP